MFVPFRNITTRQSVAYGVLCVGLMGGIKYLDTHIPEEDPMAATHDRLAWSDIDEQAARKKKKKSGESEQG